MRLHVRWIFVFVTATALSMAGCSSETPSTPPSGDNTSTSDSGVGPIDSQGNPATTSNSGQTSQKRVEEKFPVVVLKTSYGDIRIKLNAEKAPLTVDNFLSYVDSGHYDKTVFHQVVKDYIVLGGGYTADLAAKETRTPIRNEADNGLRNKRGTVAMARQMDLIDSSTSQFFINLQDNPTLDHKGRTLEDYGFCVFGEVIEGMDILDKLAEIPVEDANRDGELFEYVPTKTVLIEQAARTRQ